jgi:hypothetical protein
MTWMEWYDSLWKPSWTPAPIRPHTTTNFRDRRNSPGAYQFPWAASRRISMSKTWSTTTFFRQEFSFCNAFNCLAIAGCMPPHF